MTSLTQFGNDLYTGKRSIDFVGKKRIWFSIAAVLVLLSIVIPILRGGFDLGIEFRGGSEFHVSGVQTQDQDLATSVVTDVVPGAAPRVSNIGEDGLRVQTDELEDAQANEIRAGLAEAYGVDESEVSVSFIGPSWGADITTQAIRGLIIFVVLAIARCALSWSA